MSLFNKYLEDHPTEVKKELPIQPVITKTKEFWDIESKLHNHLVEEMKKNPIQDRDKERKRIYELGQIFFEQEGSRLTFEEKNEILAFVEYELLAYGPITPLLDDPLISEVMVNGPIKFITKKTEKFCEVESLFEMICMSCV